MSPSSEPDIAFGTIPEVGIAAAVADNRPAYLGDMLRRHGFVYNPQRDVYLHIHQTDHDTAVRAVAAATRQFQDAGWSVATDPRVVIPPTPHNPQSGLPVHSEPLKNLTSSLPGFDAPEDVADWLKYPAHEQVGVLPQLQRFLTAAAEWCDHYPDPNSPDLAWSLRNLARHVGFLGDELTDTAQQIGNLMPPALARERPADRAQEDHAARSRAATASSPHRTTEPTKPSEPEPGPLATEPLAARRHR